LTIKDFFSIFILLGGAPVSTDLIDRVLQVGVKVPWTDKKNNCKT